MHILYVILPMMGLIGGLVSLLLLILYQALAALFDLPLISNSKAVGLIVLSAFAVPALYAMGYALSKIKRSDNRHLSD